MPDKPYADENRLEMSREQELPAGCFSSWLRRMRLALIKGNGVDVSCGKCNACCTSAYFIHIKPGETEALSRINKKLLFPAPGMPKGYVLLGYDKNGRCPMLVNNRCSIYEYRPSTCRSYDCRIYAAAGIEAGDDDKALINSQIKCWQFSYPTELDHELHAAVKNAAAFIRDNAGCFPGGAVPSNPSQLAILAIKVYKVFLEQSGTCGSWRTTPGEEVARAVVEANGNFGSSK